MKEQEKMAVAEEDVSATSQMGRELKRVRAVEEGHETTEKPMEDIVSSLTLH